MIIQTEPKTSARLKIIKKASFTQEDLDPRNIEYLKKVKILTQEKPRVEQLEKENASTL